MNLITASHNGKILNLNLAASAFYKSRTTNSLRVMKGYTNVSKAYNIATEQLEPLKYNVYSHHDVYLPPIFEANLCNSISKLNAIDNSWGVLGCAGATIENGKRVFYEYIFDRGKELGSSKGLPQEVQTLDEVLLITRGDFIFDEQFDLHFYGSDICCQAMEQGRKCYVIDAYIHHNSTNNGVRDKSYNECKRKFKEKWKTLLPVNTNTALIEL